MCALVADAQDDIPAFIKEKGGIEPAVHSFDELYRNLKLFLQLVSQRKENLTGKIAETESTLTFIKMLEERSEETIHTRFELANGVYLPVAIKEPKTAKLWIGANVMLEYPFPEAREMLTRNLQTARENIDKLNTDLAHLTREIAKIEDLVTKIVDAGVAQL